MGTLTSRLVVSLKDDVSGPAKKVSEALKRAEQQAEAIGKGGFSDRFAQQLANLGLRARDIDKLTDSWRTYARSQGLAERSSEWTRAQTSRIRAWENANISALRHVAREQEHLAVASNRLATGGGAHRSGVGLGLGMSMPGMLGVGAGLLAGHRAKEFAKKSVVSAAEFDIAVRKQRNFVDISKEDQDRILIPQAKKIGQDTQFTNLDVVKAQTSTMQGLPGGMDAKVRVEVAAAIMNNVKNYAMLMEADLEESADGIRSFLQQTNKDISTKEKAIAESTRTTNLVIKMAKLGGMNNDDIQQHMKFGAATATASGLSDTTIAALGALARRSGLRGAESGVFMRAAASKLVAPTSQGLDALTAAGIDYNKFTKMPGGLNVGNLQSFTKRRFGRGFTAGQIERLDDVLSNPEVVGNKDEFIKEVTPIIAEGFKKNKKGKLTAQDSTKIAKLAGDFHKLSVESVDTEGLLNAIMNSKMGIALLNKFFTDKHGGKAAILATHWDQFKADRAELEHVAQDPEFAARKAKDVMDGLGGSLERLKGSVETLMLSFGQANEKWLKPLIDKTGETIDAISNSSDKKKIAATAVVATGAVATGAQLAGAGGAFAKGGVIGGATSGLQYMKHDAETGHHARSWLRDLLGIKDEHEPAPWQPGGSARRDDEVRLAMGVHDAKMVPNVDMSKQQPSSMLTNELLSGVDSAQAAGVAFGNAFRAGVAEPLSQAVQDARNAVAQIVAALNFSASPSLNPTAPATFNERFSAIDNTHGMHSDYGIKP